jgi:hypothetical protein
VPQFVAARRPPSSSPLPAAAAAVAQVFNRHKQQGLEQILPALSFHEGFCCSCRRICKDGPWLALCPAPQPPLQRGQRHPLPYPGLQPTLAANTVIRCTGHNRRIVPSWGRRSSLQGQPQPPLTSPHLTSPHLTSPHLTSPHLTSPHLTSPHITSSHSKCLLFRTINPQFHKLIP